MEKVETLIIAPDLEEIQVVWNVVECTFNGSYIRWVLCVDGRIFDDSDKRALKLRLQAAIGMASNNRSLASILKNEFKFIHTEVFIKKEITRLKRLKVRNNEQVNN